MRSASLPIAAILATLVPLSAPAQERFPYAALQQSLDRIGKGELIEAAQSARSAIEQAPDSGLTQTLVGTLWLYNGDPKRAKTAFLNAVAHRADRPLALYGLGLTQLAEGDPVGAAASWKLAQTAGGENDVLILAQNYAQWLSGASITPNIAPTQRTASAHAALNGMTALKKRNRAEAKSALQTALPPPAPSLMRQAAGLLMTFQRASPFATGYRALFPKTALETAPDNEEAIYGEAQLRPENIDASVAYVMYDLDGRSIGLVNSRPFGIVWNSKEVANGRHNLVITFFNANGAEINKVERRIRVRNPENEPANGEEAEKRAEMRSKLWNLLALQPDRCACAVALGETCGALGEREAAKQWLWRAAAMRPNYPQIREKLAQWEGLDTAGYAFYSGRTDEKQIALTFDDGPKPGMTEPLLELLAQAKAPSTFFIIGRHVNANPALSREIATNGHEIANHSYTHRNLTRLSEEDLEREIAETQAAAFLATGKLPRFVRPPGGNWNPQVAAIAKKWGLTPGFWSVDVYGAEVIGAQEVARMVLEQTRPGSVILMHNGKANTLQALPIILKELKRRGYAFVTMETLEKRLQQAQKSEREALRALGAKKRRIAE